MRGLSRIRGRILIVEPDQATSVISRQLLNRSSNICDKTRINYHRSCFFKRLPKLNRSVRREMLCSATTRPLCFSLTCRITLPIQLAVASPTQDQTTYPIHPPIAIAQSEVKHHELPGWIIEYIGVAGHLGNPSLLLCLLMAFNHCASFSCSFCFARCCSQRMR